MNLTPIRNVKTAIQKYLTPEERKNMSNYFLADAIKLTNNRNIIEYNYRNSSKLFGFETLGEDDIFIGVYHELLYRQATTGELKNTVTGLDATNNVALIGLYNGTYSSTAGTKQMISAMSTTVLEARNDHDASLEAGGDTRMLIQPFVYQGRATFKGQISLPTEFEGKFSEETSGSVTAANQMYSIHGFHGIIIRNFGNRIGAENWADFDTFVAALRAR